MKKYILLGIALVVLMSILFVVKKQSSMEVNNKTTQIVTSVITYQTLNVVESNDEEYLYLTIRKYQAEEVETVKVKKKLAKDVKSDKSYESTFQYKAGAVEENIKSIFQNAELISIIETDKKGMDQRQDFIQCPSEKVFNL